MIGSHKANISNLLVGNNFFVYILQRMRMVPVKKQHND